MKALSVHPEYTMDIFVGAQTYEERTWQTDYRGDLLICASSKSASGFVSGYAYFVIPLVDIQASDQEVMTATGKITCAYHWILGKPKAIKPIPVKGKLHLYDVDDALIHYVKGGDLSAYQTEDDADRFREAFIAAYLDPLLHGDTKGASSSMPDPDVPLLTHSVDEIPPIEREDDILLPDTLDAMLFLPQEPPMTKQYDAGRGSMGIKHAGYNSLKQYVIDWYWAKNVNATAKYGGRRLKPEEEPGTYAYYMRFMNVYGLLWMAEVFGEAPEKLKEAMDAALAVEKDSADAGGVAFRKVIPFRRIVELFDNPRGWLIDEELKPMMSFRKRDGSPNVAKGMGRDFERALHKQGIYLE